MTQPDNETLQEIIEKLQPENHIGALLVAQMGMTPEEIQIIIQTNEYHEEEKALAGTGAYIVRGLGVQEHRLRLGMFSQVVFSKDHPLLWNHNYAYRQVYFKGKPEDVNDLMLDLNQLYGQHYGIYRSLADDINRARPLGTLLSAGYGLLGEMPEPMAEKVRTLLEKHGLTVDLVESDIEAPPVKFQLLVMDDSFLIASVFSADPMKGKAEDSA